MTESQDRRISGYATPAALRAALTDRLRPVAKAGPHRLDELQRQLAYDRRLARVFTSPDAACWVLKGAGALLARLRTVRHSMDIDLFRVGALPEAERSLRAAAARDLGDRFTFDLAAARTLDEARRTLRVSVRTTIGTTEYARFHVDLVADVLMTGQPDTAEPLVDVDLPGLVRVNYRIYPLADHVADKLCAITETHQLADGTDVPSSRVKDLVDLVVIALRQPLAADDLTGPSARRRRAEGSSGQRASPRPTHAPGNVLTPGTRAKSPISPTSPPARAPPLVGRLLDPILRGIATGFWNPTDRTYVPCRTVSRPAGGGLLRRPLASVRAGAGRVGTAGRARMLDHLAVQVADVDAATDFYLRVFAPLGIRQAMRFDREGSLVVGLSGPDGFPRFWLGSATGSPGREVHVAFTASNRAAVDAVHRAAIAAGTEILHAPKVWPEYHSGYYGVFLRDLDGNNVEAVYHGLSKPTEH